MCVHKDFSPLVSQGGLFLEGVMSEKGDMKIMTDELKPVRCGCGGEARVDVTLKPYAPVERTRIYCSKCEISTDWKKSEAEAIEAWNKAMGKRYKLLRVGEWIPHPTEREWDVCSVCGIGCKRREYEMQYGTERETEYNYPFCPHCGAKLD